MKLTIEKEADGRYFFVTQGDKSVRCACDEAAWVAFYFLRHKLHPFLLQPREERRPLTLPDGLEIVERDGYWNIASGKFLGTVLTDEEALWVTAMFLDGDPEYRVAMIT